MAPSSLFVIDKWGRKKVMAIILTIIVLMFVGLSVMFYIRPSLWGFIALFLRFYAIVYSPGMVTTPWVVNAEVYPFDFRGFGGRLQWFQIALQTWFLVMSFLAIFYRYHKPLYENKQIVYPHGYGKHLVSNNHKRTDATFIIYNNGKNYKELYEQM